MEKSLAQMRDENEGAFTLVELLVVILIIGILAAIAIPAFLNQRKAAVDSSVQSDVKNAATQVETWMASNPSTAVPTFTVNADGSINEGASTTDAAVSGSLSDIKVSDGTTLNIAPGSARGTYTVTGFNVGGNKSVESADAAVTTDGVRYISASGGLQK